jgi:hypothetical protein
LVAVVRATPVAVFVTVTVADGTAASVASVTIPTIVALVVWAVKEGAKTKTTVTILNQSVRFSIGSTPPLH